MIYKDEYKLLKPHFDDLGLTLDEDKDISEIDFNDILMRSTAKVTADFIKAFERYLSWHILSQRSNLDIEAIRIYQSTINFTKLARNRFFTLEMLEEFIDRIDLEHYFPCRVYNEESARFILNNASHVNEDLMTYTVCAAINLELPELAANFKTYLSMANPEEVLRIIRSIPKKYLMEFDKQYVKLIVRLQALTIDEIISIATAVGEDIDWVLDERNLTLTELKAIRPYLTEESQKKWFPSS